MSQETTIGGLLDDQQEAFKRAETRLRRRQFDVMARALVAQDKTLSKIDLGLWGAATRQRLMVMVAQGTDAMAAAQAMDLGIGLYDVAKVGQRSVAQWLTTLDHTFLGKGSRLAWNTAAWRALHAKEIVGLRLRTFQTSFVRYGSSVVLDIERAMLGLQVGLPWSAVREQVAKTTRDVVGNKAWMVDRIVRTEASQMLNGLTQRALEAEDEPGRPMFKKLVTTFDPVTGKDSVLLDGQIKPVREPFFDSFHGFEYMHPPNRPNDRERMVGWRGAWGTDKKRARRRVRKQPAPTRESRAAAAEVIRSMGDSLTEQAMVGAGAREARTLAAVRKSAADQERRMLQRAAAKAKRARP